MSTTPRNPSCCLVLKNQLAITRNLGFLRNDCAYGGGESRKPMKKPGRNPRLQKAKCFGWISVPKKGCALCASAYTLGTSFYKGGGKSSL
jgi:hypothetical protein